MNERLLRPLALAAGMMTVVRLPEVGEVRAEELSRSTAFYPLIGLGVGLVPALALLLPIAAGPRASLALSLWVVVTGALHLDGWADSADAAFIAEGRDPQASRSRRLEVLRDPRVGTFGVVALSLLLISKWSVLVHSQPIAPLLAAPTARWAMVWALAALPPARADGLGASLAGGARLGGATGVLLLVLGLIGGLVIILRGFGLDLVGGGVAPLGLAGIAVLSIVIVAAGIIFGIGLGRLLAWRFGGMTGDLCGAVGEGVELVVLWVGLLTMGGGPW